MLENGVIQKSRTLPPAEDFAFLRAEGLRHIEALAHGLWTDYNTHDPGITILEALCYALTELGYRTGFDVNDLLADEKGAVGKDQAFFTPRKILTTEPYTLTDYRKLLIDLDGVNNAWILPAIETDAQRRAGGFRQAEVPLYPDCKRDRLTYGKTHHDAVDLRGLYRVKLDLDNSDLFGDLNSGHLDYTVFGADLRGAQIECVLPRYNEVPPAWLAEVYAVPPQSATATPVKFDAAGKPVRWSVLLAYDTVSGHTTFAYDVQPSLKLPVQNFEALLEAELEQPLVQQQIMERYFNKTERIRGLVQTAWETAHGHRNFCEDWWTVDTVRNTPVALCADVDVTPEADIENVYAAIAVAIETYLNPPVKFYGLKELQEEGVAVENIFEGPKLQHGFLLDEDVEKAELRNRVYGSDVISIVMDVDGVVAVRNLVMTAYDDNGNPVLPSQQWCLHIPDDHKPVLDLERSKLLFFKNRLPYKIRFAEARDTVLYLRGLNAGYKIINGKNDLPLPTGRHYALSSYSSVQHDLPDTYGTGKAGLPATVSEERKARAKQLKAYLLFYDQILAGFFAQLQGAKSLLGLDENIRQTYFQQFLKDGKEDEETGVHNVADLYTDENSLRKILSAPAAGEDSAITTARQKLLEDDETLYDRRHRFLDHLIARFAESFNEYALMLYASKKEIDQQELVRDKIRFVKNYPYTSSHRGSGYRILAGGWESLNTSGLEARVAALTGINDASRRNLFCYPLAEMKNDGTDADPKFGFVLKDKDGTEFLKPIAPQTTAEKAEALLNDVYENLLIAANYLVKEDPAGVFTVYLTNTTGSRIATGVGTFSERAAAESFIANGIKKLKPDCDEEGLHLVEHFLLRPRFAPPLQPPKEAEEVYKLLTVCLPEDCLFCGEEDPYSFRTTIVLPYWPQRFRDAAFRSFLEATAKREAPAHVHVKVCWIGFTDMYRFETAYRIWLEALKNYARDQSPDTARRDALRSASNDLVDVLNHLKTIYPEATLHDCVEGTTNPVRLGRTNLGSF